MRTISAFFTTTLCLTSTIAVLMLMRAGPAFHECGVEAPEAGDAHLDDATGDATGDATELRESLAGSVLVAAPSMQDPYFAGTVIYMLADDEDGALGVVLNRSRDQSSEDRAGVPLWDGGPVGRDRVFVLHDDVADQSSVRVGGVAVAAEPAILDELFAGRGPAHARVFVGYAGWGPGQLGGELDAGAWHTMDFAPALILSHDRTAITTHAYSRYALVY